MIWNSYQEFSEWFWDESIWLGKVTSWKKLKASRLPITENLGGLYLCIPVAVFLMVFRYVFERYIASPFVQWLGVKDKPPVKVSDNAACEKVYKKSKKPSHQNVLELSEHLGWSTREVERWFRLRRMKNQPTVLTKATECSWRLLFYFGVTVFGTITLSKFDCFHELKQCYIGYTSHVIQLDLYIYFIVEIAMYIALSISQFTDVQRKDFLQNVVHHILTLALLCYSYIGGYYHIGALIVYTHDVSDVFLEAAKIFHYAKRQKICDACFVVFACVFYISRLYFLPFRIMMSACYDHDVYVGDFFMFRVMIYFMYSLQVLHIYWAYCIGIIVYKALIGKGVTDSRSEGEEDSEPELKNHQSVPLENKKKD